MGEFNRLEQYANLQKPRRSSSGNLEAVVNTRITYNLLPVKVHADYIA